MLGDPAIPSDNTYQTILVIAGTTYVLDAKISMKAMVKHSTSMIVYRKRMPSVAFVVHRMGLSTVWLMHLMILQSMKRWIRPMNGIIGQEFNNGQNFPKMAKLLREQSTASKTHMTLFRYTTYISSRISYTFLF